MKRLVPVAAAVLLLAGCAGSPAPTETPTPTVEASTIEQWASMVAQQKAEWDQWQLSWDEQVCSSLAVMDDSNLICAVQLLGASFMTTTTALAFEGAVKPGVPAFIAEEPPDEIAALVDRTAAAADSARDAGEDWTAAECHAGGPDVCDALTRDFVYSIDDLQSEFAAWAPYM